MHSAHLMVHKQKTTLSKQSSRIYTYVLQSWQLSQLVMLYNNQWLTGFPSIYQDIWGIGKPKALQSMRISVPHSTRRLLGPYWIVALAKHTLVQYLYIYIHTYIHMYTHTHTHTHTYILTYIHIYSFYKAAPRVNLHKLALVCFNVFVSHLAFRTFCFLPAYHLRKNISNALTNKLSLNILAIKSIHSFRI